MLNQLAKTVFGAAILAACGYGFGAALGAWNADLFGDQDRGAVFAGLLLFCVIGASLLPWRARPPAATKETLLDAPGHPFASLPTVPYWTNPDDACWLPEAPSYNDDIKAIDRKEAQALFDAFKSAREINWLVLDRHCEARADMMCELAARQGLRMSKIWASAEPFERLSALTGMESKLTTTLDRAGTERVDWNYHVAAANLVQSDDGNVRNTVFDPVLFDKPVSVPEWSARIFGCDEPAHIIETARECFQSPHDDGEIWARDINYRERNAILRQHFNFDDDETRSSYLRSLRAHYTDGLLQDDATQLEELKTYLEDEGFRSWWRADLPDRSLARLADVERYYHLDAAALQDALACEDPLLLGRMLRLSAWRKVGPFFLALSDHLNQLRLGHGPKAACEEVAAAFLARSMEDPSPLLDEWRSPFAHALWERLGFPWRDVT